MMEYYSTEMKNGMKFFQSIRYKNIGKIRQKFLKVKNVVGMRKTCYGMYTMRKEEQKK